MQCLFCDESVEQADATHGHAACSEVWRVQTGGVIWRKWGLQFVGETFEDDSRVKWICKTCAVEHCVFPEVLSLERCELCIQDFEPANSNSSDCVLLMEFGLISPSGKGPFVSFRPQYGGFVHFTCACDDLNLPLWNLDRVA